jgi:hypothetical protein
MMVGMVKNRLSCSYRTGYTLLKMPVMGGRAKTCYSQLLLVDCNALTNNKW